MTKITLPINKTNFISRKDNFTTDFKGRVPKKAFAFYIPALSPASQGP